MLPELTPPRARPFRIWASQAGFWVVLVASVLVLGVQIAHYYPYIADDTFISLRYSQRLLQGKGLTWNSGPPVEGYTNLLWVLLCALLGATGLDLVTAARLLGVSCTLIALAALAYGLLTRYGLHGRTAAAVACLLPFVLCAPIAVWAAAGLEQPLLLAALAWATSLTLRYFHDENEKHLFHAGFWLAAATLTRADGLLFPLLFAAVLLLRELRRGERPLAAATLFAAPAFAFCGQLLFRRLYYREWLPNTAYVKVAFTPHRVYTGAVYCWHCMAMEPGLLLLAVLGCVLLLRRGERYPALLLSIVPSVYGLYLVLVGGDIFLAARQFLPIILFLCFSAAEVGRFASTTSGLRRPFTLAALVLCVASVALSRQYAQGALLERWEFQARSLGLFFNSAFGQKHPLLVSDAAGALPYYSEMEAIDPLGLTDSHIAHHYSAARGNGYLGHELGDGKYVLDRKPDLVIFFPPVGSRLPLLPSDEEIYNDPRFSPLYQLVGFRVSGPPDVLSQVYVRREDGPLGIQAAPDLVTVPAYLATPEGTSFVSGSVQQGAVLVVPPGQSVQLLGIPLPAGRWTLAGDADGAECSTEPAPPLPAAKTAWLVKNPTDHALIFRQFSFQRQLSSTKTNAYLIP